MNVVTVQTHRELPSYARTGRQIDPLVSNYQISNEFAMCSKSIEGDVLEWI